MKKFKTVLEVCGYPTLRCDAILVEKGTYHRYKIGGCPKGESGRKETGGPEFPGPWHYIFGLATVIALDPNAGTGAEMARARKAGLVHELSPGEKIQIDEQKYIFQKSWNGVMELVEVKAKKAKVTR